jgi:hypothetical protein
VLSTTAKPETAPALSRLSPRKADLVALGLLLALTAIKGLLWVNLIAPLDAPDEPSHFNYVVQVREGYKLPVVVLVSPAGLKTPPSTPLNGDLREWFARYDYKFFRSMPYESVQPPLYYWLASFLTRYIPVRPENFSLLLTAARLVSVLIGVGSVLALWLACLWAWPAARWLRIGAPLALTLSPQFTFLTSVVSNDAGMVLAGGAILALWAYGLRSEADLGGITRRRLVVLAALAAVITGAGFLTKTTFAATVPATLVWLYWLAHRPGVTFRFAFWRLLGSTVLFGGIALAIVLPWILRNMSVYGEPTGSKGALDLYHSIYWSRVGLPATQWFSGFDPMDFLGQSWRSSWALFGWASVSLDEWVYWLLGALTLIALAGLFLRGGRSDQQVPRVVTRITAMSGVVLLISFINLLGYSSLVDYQPQGRYLFVAYPAFFFLLVLGLGKLRWPAGKRLLLPAFVLILVAVHVGSLVVLNAHTQSVLAAVGK